MARFMARGGTRSQVLVVGAPEGMGARRLAAQWASGAVESAMGDLDVLVDDLIHFDGDRRAVLARTISDARYLTARVPCVSASPRELLLTLEESKAVFHADDEVIEEAYHVTGGWWKPMNEMVVHGRSSRDVLEMIAAWLLPWLRSESSPRAWRWLAQVDEVDAAFLRAVQGETSQRVPSMRELHRIGLIRPEGDDGAKWFVPLAVREALEHYDEDAGYPGVPAVAVLPALLDGRNVTAAVEVASRTGSWDRLTSIVTERWAEWIGTDARGIRRMVGILARAHTLNSAQATVIERVQQAVDSDRMVLPIPPSTDYQDDRQAERLHERFDAARRRPGLRAAVLGLLEQSHLRLAGHHPQAAENAAALRDVLAARPIPRSFAGLIELQCAISLHLDDRLVEAGRAYEASRYVGERRRVSFLRANAAAGLALASAERGDSEQVARWLAEHDDAVTHVGWGREMVGRCAALARGLSAVWRLDGDTLRQVLATLPAQPDHDEFWAVHLDLLVQADLLIGDLSTARSRLTRTQAERGRPSGAYSRRHLDHAGALLAVHSGDLSHASVAAPGTRSRMLNAVGALATGDRDRAVQVLSVEPPSGAGARLWWPYTALRAFARDGVGASLTEHIRHHPVDPRFPGDLFVFQLLGTVDALADEGLVPRATSVQLSGIHPIVDRASRRPTLTPREKEVLAMLRLGLPRAEIAALQHRSPSTVKTQIRSLYRKLGATSRQEALDTARRAGL